MLKQKYQILLEAICLGIPVKYGEGWQLILDKNDVLHEVSYDLLGEKVSRKSTITLQEFIKNFKEIPTSELKRVFGDIRLHRLQERLIANE